jgi:hypothetical protein
VSKINLDLLYRFGGDVWRNVTSNSYTIKIALKNGNKYEATGLDMDSAWQILVDRMRDDRDAINQFLDQIEDEHDDA